ncbi:MAG: alanine racemase [Rhizobiales bacterium]|nr:alanine racemase [Hyphomicrobiales bacterium]
MTDVRLNPSGPAGAQATLEIDLGALADNWRRLAARAAPGECAAVVKADAYGIGIGTAVPALAKAGARTFCVAHLSEALRVRALAPEATIYLLNGLPPADVAALAPARIRPVLGSLEQIARWRAAGAGPCAVQIDTGMNRFGLSCADAATLHPADFEALGVELLMTHFVASEEPQSALNARQIAAFEAARARFLDVPASIANSSALFLPTLPGAALARPGYALYGGNPCPGAANPMRPVVSLRAPILALRRIGRGETVGYNAQWTARRPTLLATIGVGYADGYPRSAGGTDARGGAQAVVAGARCPLAGRVSMDLIVVDATDAPHAEVGDPVALLGDGIGVDDLAGWAGTNGYEVLTRLGARYARRSAG